MLLHYDKRTKLEPFDIIYFAHPTIGIARNGKRVMIVHDAHKKNHDDKFFFGFLNERTFKKLVETIAFLAGYTAKPVSMASRQPAYQFLPSDHLHYYGLDIPIRPNDVITYDSRDARVTLLRNQMVVDCGVTRLPEFFCFAKFLGLALGFDIRFFHKTPDELHLQFVLRK